MARWFFGVGLQAASLNAAEHPFSVAQASHRTLGKTVVPFISRRPTDFSLMPVAT